MNLKILIAKTAGFCFGVERAVDMAFSHGNEPATYTYGPIIHNEVVTDQLQQQGIFVIDDLEEVKADKVEKLIIRSHGVSPDVYEEARAHHVEIVDATCPYVKKIHRYVEKYDKLGYHILVAGNSAHPEIQGINGWAQGKCFIAKDVEALKEVELPEGHYLFVAQTTYKREVVEEMQAYLKEKGIAFEYINTICNATKERQEEAVSLAKQVDCMLVLGSPSSANTKKLYEISEANCKKSYCIAGAQGLEEEMFAGCETVGITAGASTPQSVIEEVIEWINHFEER